MFQRGQVVLAGQVDTLAHQHSQGGWGGVEDRYPFLLQDAVPPPRVEVGRVGHHGRPAGQRADDAI